jgi:predicted dehydrogenase/NADPH:quinone reductase-like Zn-dependent oxidoreductase
VHQVVQEINSGKLRVTDIPAPLAQPGEVLIANVASIISAGTERMVIDLAKKSLLGKARERPDLVRRVIEKCRNEGVLNTLRQVRERLDTPMSMGYSSAGVVLACGRGVKNFQPGDRVASNGPHAEIVTVGKHLCARMPDNVDFEHAAFAVLAAIALNGVRLSSVRLGETVFVIGLGLIGQITVALAAASGCRVIGTDLDASKCELALKMGAEIARPGLSGAEIESSTAGLGADAVLITASTPSNGPIDLAAAAVRKKGRVVLVGVVGLELDRRPFYFKEAEFVVSCSYGPGRYDPEYEDRGHDYPAAYVRWTEERNLQAVLELMGRGKLDLRPLISHRFPIHHADAAYELIEKGREPSLGLVLEYPFREEKSWSRAICFGLPKHKERPAVGVLGAGNFARLVLLPALRDCDRLRLSTLCTAGGLSAVTSGQKLGFEKATTDEREIFENPEIDAVLSITRHDLHAGHVIRAIQAGKAIFVEKPLCLTEDELIEIESALGDAGETAPLLMVGFNRRFSAAAVEVRRFFANVESPLTVSIRFNAGPLPADHWLQNDEEGGGRIIGEACHAIDLATFLVGAPPVRVFAESVGRSVAAPADDQCFMTLRHVNGSISSVAYLAGGDRSFPKERIEVIGGGRNAVIDDFRTITLCRSGRITRKKLRGQDKGHRAEIAAFAEALIKGAPAPIPWGELRAVTLASLMAVRSLREGVPIDL